MPKRLRQCRYLYCCASPAAPLDLASCLVSGVRQREGFKIRRKHRVFSKGGYSKPTCTEGGTRNRCEEGSAVDNRGTLADRTRVHALVRLCPHKGKSISGNRFIITQQEEEEMAVHTFDWNSRKTGLGGV